MFWHLYISLDIPDHIVQSVMYLTADTCLTTDPGFISSDKFSLIWSSDSIIINGSFNGMMHWIKMCKVHAHLSNKANDLVFDACKQGSVVFVYTQT